MDGELHLDPSALRFRAAVADAHAELGEAAGRRGPGRFDLLQQVDTGDARQRKAQQCADRLPPSSLRTAASSDSIAVAPAAARSPIDNGADSPAGIDRARLHTSA